MTKIENSSGLEPVSTLAAKKASDERMQAANKLLAEREAAGTYFPQEGAPRTNFLPLVPLNTLPNIDDGQPDTVPLDQHQVGLSVRLLEWVDMDGANWHVRFGIDDDELGAMQIVSPGFGQLDVLVQLGTSRYQHGFHTVYFMAENQFDFNDWRGGDRNFYIDITDPNGGLEAGAPLLPADLPNGVVDSDYLDANGGVTFTLPTPRDHKPEDTYSFFIGETEVFTGEPLAAPFEVTVPRAVFDNLPAGVHMVAYMLEDRAGNHTDRSLAERIVLSKVPAPTLLAPVIPQGGVITLDEARIGVPVWHNYSPVQVGDIVTVTWVGRLQEPYIVPQEYQTVSFEEILKGGRSYTGEVTYQVLRGGATYTSPPATIEVDLEHTGPINPEEPGPNPVNPLLPKASLLSSTSKTDIIDPGDKNNPATITVPLYTGAAVGEVIQVYYGDVLSPVGAPVTLEATDITEDKIEVVLPWDMIEAKGDGTIRLFYQIYPAGKPENWQQSEDTDVNVTVNAIEDLPPAEFPDRHPVGNVINCEHAPWINGVNVLMAYPSFEIGDELTLDWVLDSTFPPLPDDPIPQTPLEDTRTAFTRVVTATDVAAGQVILNVKWGDHLSAIARGSIVVSWHLSRNGGAVSGTSQLSYVRYSREGGGLVCGPTA